MIFYPPEAIYDVAGFDFKGYSNIPGEKAYLIQREQVTIPDFNLLNKAD
jgi:hypothetical protein